MPAQDTDLNAVIAQERQVLKAMVDQRMEASTTEGLKELELPDGRHEAYISIEVWDRRIQELRARIAWLEQAAAGNVLPRVEVWRRAKGYQGRTAAPAWQSRPL